MLYIPQDKMYARFLDVLRNDGVSEEKSRICARLLTDSSLDGFHSHGVNRFASFVRKYREGRMAVDKEPVHIGGFGAIEQWDGQSGMGPVNALFCTDRALALADSFGIGMVALKNNTHWMRAGSYGWRAAEKGYAFICWTNTMPNMPPWEGKSPAIGNNPLVMAFPRKKGPFVLDMAMSQFSFGKLNTYSLAGKELDIPGGYSNKGDLTRKPDEILESKRPLPIGYWKGSGLSIMLDLLAAAFSGGNPTSQISSEERDVSQIFIAVSVETLGGQNELEKLADQVAESLQEDEGNSDAAYPGYGTKIRRKEYTEKGIPVEEKVWQEIESL